MMMRPKPPSLFYLPQNPKQRDIQKRNKFGRGGGTFGSVDDFTFAAWALTTRRVQQRQQQQQQKTTTREMTTVGGNNNDGGDGTTSKGGNGADGVNTGSPENEENVTGEGGTGGASGAAIRKTSGSITVTISNAVFGSAIPFVT